jgi:cystathionine beta-lyase
VLPGVAGRLALPGLDGLPGTGTDAESLDGFMLTRARLWLDKGQKSGREGHGYIRVSLGCPRSTLDEAIRRLPTAVAGL